MKKQNTLDLVTKVFLEIKLDEIKEEIDENAKNYRDDVLTKLDEVMGELETIREENILGNHHVQELRKQDANHERRLRRLEHVQKTA